MKRVPLQGKVLSENDRIAERLRECFREQGVLALNLIGSPGAGKTSLLERTLERLPSGASVGVLTGDIATENDARRLARFGFPVKQITTGGACHLDARMVERALQDWRDLPFEFLFIENVGNLVCPSSFDLGEAAKVVVLSTPEGADKPLKYPGTMHRAELLILNKTDLLPFVSFDLGEARRAADRAHPGIVMLEISCASGTGIDGWMEWLQSRRRTWAGERWAGTARNP